ncbi:S-adenosyl-L-methionine-dependent methyltransferase [Tribonema minus]|uniref:rRNA adenine N(6)-methyltransferase n=1 Tax=Tribonema minus TaxID=303371 RepID=A0A835Z0Q3_9STRA|nr:S-adenosyl-L-methionine-dependent methyltransferase [Tribonema minus]
MTVASSSGRRSDTLVMDASGAGGSGRPAAPKKMRPPTLPAGEYKPKQSLGQNFLSDQNYVMKICSSFRDSSVGGRSVVELGPGAGALTQVLHAQYPDMMAVDIDERSVQFLAETLPGLTVLQSDVLQIDYTQLAEARGGQLSIIGNLPYHITSQILFMLCDHYRSIARAVVLLQLEVAQRIVAPPNCKEYGILSVVFQLYTRPRILFKIPATVFYPQPKVTSALLSLDFTGRGPDVDRGDLKKVLSTAFQQRRKMLRQSLRPLLTEGVTLPEKFSALRPEQLTPQQFVELTKAIFGDTDPSQRADSGPVWRSI